MRSGSDLSYLGVMIDMAGCPNRCRHCWLGSHRNGNISPQEFREIAREFWEWRDENGNGIKELGFFSWWREPDYRDDYRELWELEQALSSPGRAQRFELLSTWRLARDESYASWAAKLPPRVCQISFFGMEENTDWAMRRRGAFRDQILATERCLAVGIAPRWQLFLTRRCLHELDEFLRLIHDLKLPERCRAIGQEFVMFFGGITPEGNGYELEDVRLEAGDLEAIPRELIAISREGLELLGRPEHELYEELLRMDAPPNVEVDVRALAINADFDVYSNLAEPTEWWRLGNLKRDGLDSILRSYRDETTPSMRANRTIPVAGLTRRYGNRESSKLYRPDDLICRFLHQWGIEYMGPDSRQ